MAKRWKLLCGAASMLALSSPVHAADEAKSTAGAGSSRMLEEVVVTARRQTESLLNVPVTVTAISKQMLERAHVTDLQQIAEMTPNLFIVSVNSGTGGAISLRGVGGSATDPGIEQSVGINLDGVSVGRGRFILASQFDLQQVEVLKGPQALFFGKNSPAGVISITSADPTRTFTAMVRTGYETEASENFVEAYVSGPITDKLLFRLAGKFDQMDGWLTNETQPGYPNLAIPGYTTLRGFNIQPASTSYAGRLTLKWEPTNNFTANLKFLIDNDKGNGDDAIEHFCGGQSLAQGGLNIRSIPQGKYVTDPQSDCYLNQVVSIGAVPTALQANWPGIQHNNGRPWNNLEIYMGSLTLNYQVANLSITSVTGFTKLFAQSENVSDGTSFAEIVSNPAERARTVSEELRVVSNFESPVNFTLGGYFEDASRTDTYNPFLGFIGFDASNGGSSYTFLGKWDNSDETYSAFGQMRWKIIPTLELTGGVRYTYENKSTTGQNLYLNGLGHAFGLAPVGAIVAVNPTFSNWSPEVTLTYKPTTNIMAYVAYKTGYKSGGISTPATINASYVVHPDALAFQPETSAGYEGGVKAEFFDRSLRLDLTGYSYDFSNLQLTNFNPALVAYFVRNAGKSRTTGVEGSAVWRATHELTLHTTMAYNHARYLVFTGAQCPTQFAVEGLCTGPGGTYDRSGQPLNRAPEFTFNGGFNYERSIGSNLKIAIGTEAIYTSSFRTHETGDPAGTIAPFWRLNANLSLARQDDKWELAFIGRNLTNHYYFLYSGDSVLSQPGNYAAYTLRPRELVLQATVKF
jgi:outer membrane receptor protein involved in Fe transport